MAGHLHLQVGVGVGFDLLKGFAEGDDFGVGIEFGIAVGKVLGYETVVAGLFVDDVGVRGV